MNVALHSERLDYISLCTGGGGLDLGLELAMPAARAVCLVEREAFAVGHLVAAMQQGLLAQAPVWSDVRTFAGRPWRGLVDGVIGGIPCQPHSLAGKRLGEEDERDLWSDARRIIVQSGAWFVLIENVEGMLTSGGAERVVRDLRRLGFAPEIGLFSASEAGASHQRTRVFILAVADANGRQPPWWSAGCCEAAGRVAHPESAGSRLQLADTGCLREQRWRGAGDLPSAPAEGEGEAHQRQRHGHAAGNGCEAVAHAGSPRSQRSQSGGTAGSRREGRAAERDCCLVEDAARVGDRAVSIQQGQSRRPDPDAAWSGTINAVPGLFPPGPSDLDGWRRVLEDSPHLEPAVRRMVDGVAARLDLAGPHAARIERLRLLGNGVVCLEAAYAIRTLAARLAAGGSATAIHVVRMMMELA